MRQNLFISINFWLTKKQNLKKKKMRQIKSLLPERNRFFYFKAYAFYTVLQNAATLNDWFLTTEGSTNRGVNTHMDGVVCVKG